MDLPTIDSDCSTSRARTISRARTSPPSSIGTSKRIPFVRLVRLVPPEIVSSPGRARGRTDDPESVLGCCSVSIARAVDAVGERTRVDQQR